jgi:hypothetical protein
MDIRPAITLIELAPAKAAQLSALAGLRSSFG